jgi:hypothetical protein
MIQFQQRDLSALGHRPAERKGYAGNITVSHRMRRQIRRWTWLTMFSLMWGPIAVLGGTPDHRNVATEHPVSGHDDVILAGFGLQSSASSSITIRTYHAQTGAILSEDSYDLTVQEEGNSGDARRGRIFAGGIGMDKDGRPRFLLRVYDALHGRFLWEGQLNLISQKEERRTRPIATVTRSRSAVWRTGTKETLPVQAQFSLRAVDPQSGRLVWEDKFIPGAALAGRADRTGFTAAGGSVQIETIGHVFDLVIRTFDRASGRLLWQDSFEDMAAIAGAEREDGRLLEPRTIPFRSQPNYERGWCSLDWKSSAHCCWNLS